MAQNLVACDRDQELLLPPSLREWLPEGSLAWFVIDAVAAFDLSAFYVAYRVDGVEDEPREMVLGQPLAQARRQQQLLLAIAPDEVLRHPDMVFSPPDGALRNSHRAKRKRLPLCM